MAIDSEFKSVLGSRLFRKDEARDFVPISHAHRKLLEIAKREFPDNPGEQSKIMARYSPIVDWLIKPRSIENFQKIKRAFYSLHDANGHEDLLSIELGEKIVSDDLEDFSQPYLAPSFWDSGSKLTESGREWQSIVRWSLGISYSLRVLPLQQINKLPAYFSAESLWNKFEGNDVIPNSEVMVHDSLQNLVTFLDSQEDLGRKGLIFGDFRTGDTTDHDEVFKHAKLAVGKKGSLIVITPTKETILNTTKKTGAFNDKERLHRLRNNRNIDHLLMIDMPKNYWPSPSKFWINVWKKVSPDLIFLGETNHPLQPIYETQSRHIGSLLLIDDKPVNIRSGDLLRVKID